MTIINKEVLADHKPEYLIGGINAYEVYEKVDAYLSSIPDDELSDHIDTQIQTVADRRNGGLRKTREAVEESLFRKDPNGSDGYIKPGEIGELKEVLAIYGSIPAYKKIVGGNSPTISVQELMEEMYKKADTNDPLPCEDDDTEHTIYARAKTAVLAATTIFDEIADSVYYAHYHGDPQVLSSIMNLAQEMTGLTPAALKKLALIKYSIRNEYSDCMKSGNKKLDKKNRKGLEQAVMAEYVWEYREEMLHPYDLNPQATNMIDKTQTNYQAMEAAKLREVPISDTIITDMACTLVNLEPYFETTYTHLANKYAGYQWEHEHQEVLEARLRIAREKDPKISRLAIFAQMIGMELNDQSVEMLREERDDLLRQQIAQAEEVPLQPGVEALLTALQQKGGRLISCTGLEPDIIQLILQKAPALEKAIILPRNRGERDAEALKRIAQEQSVDLTQVTAILDAPSHVKSALEVGIASGDFKVFYRPADQYPNLEAQALSFGIKDAAENRRVWEIRSIEDIVAVLVQRE